MLDILSLREYVERRLGGTSLNIELQPKDFDAVLEEAIRLVNRHVPGERWASLGASSATKRYVVSHRNLIDVVDIDFLNEVQSTGQISDNPFLNAGATPGAVPNDLTWVPGQAQNRMSEYAMTLMSYEDRNRLFSSEPVWQSGWEYNDMTKNREYVIYVDLPENVPGILVSYKYLYKYAASDDKDVGLCTLPVDLEDWIERYVLAGCREVLGDIRNKFGGVPLPDGLGSSGPLDGERQIDRAREDMRELKEDLRRMQRQLPPLIA